MVREEEGKRPFRPLNNMRYKKVTVSNAHRRIIESAIIKSPSDWGPAAIVEQIKHDSPNGKTTITANEVWTVLNS